MAARGKSRPIRRSSNPFYAPTNEALGLDVDSHSQRQFIAPQRQKIIRKHQDDLSFMFQTSNANYGDGVEYSDSKISETLAKKTMFLKHSLPGDEPDEMEAKPSIDDINTRTGETTINTRAVQYDVHDENPMYQTTSNVIGSKHALHSDMTAPRSCLSNYFTNSFNGMKFRDQGLNTSKTTSRIHASLDQTFY